MTHNYKPIEECKTVAELLEDPNRWCHGTMCEDSCGLRLCSSDSPLAVKWCVIGAIYRVYNPRGGSYQAFERLRSRLGGLSPVLWNDSVGRTHEEVLRVVREANI